MTLLPSVTRPISGSPAHPFPKGVLPETAGTGDMPEDAERKGLGTPATRAATLEKLVSAGFVQRKKKQLIPTEKGTNLILVLPDNIKSPMLTAEWESMLKQVEPGRHLFKGLALLQRRQGSIFTFFFFRLRLFQAHAVKAFHFLPSCLQHGFSLCREGMAPAVQNQRECNRIYGYTAQQTLDYVQSLYEKKLATYPRTDSQYLTEDMQATAASLVLWPEAACPSLSIRIFSAPALSGSFSPEAVKPPQVISGT